MARPRLLTPAARLLLRTVAMIALVIAAFYGLPHFSPNGASA